MDNTSERTLEGLRVQIDRDLCVGFGDCIEVLPDVFEFDDEGIAIFKDGDLVTAREKLLDACASCRVDALVAWDEDGIQLIP